MVKGRVGLLDMWWLKVSASTNLSEEVLQGCRKSTGSAFSERTLGLVELRSKSSLAVKPFLTKCKATPHLGEPRQRKFFRP
jgi:hypothetical protein